MKKLVLSAVTMLFSFATFAQNTNDLLGKYINIKNALVSGNVKESRTAISSFYETTKSAENFTQKSELLKATEKLVKALDIEKQRAVFNEVSTLMWQIVKNADQMNQAVYYQYCPMKKAYWLSYEREIKNPYYGSSMLTCGKVTETKE